MSVPTAITRPSSMATSDRRDPRWSTTVATLMTGSGMGFLPPVGAHAERDTRAEEPVQDRHADCDAVRDLVGDHRVGPVRHLRRDLHPAVHGARVHDQRVAWHPGGPL